MTAAATPHQPVPTTLSFEEQIARLHALLEASRQIHSTIAVEEVLLQTARILVHELEFEGALFLSPAGETLVSYGDVTRAQADTGAFPGSPSDHIRIGCPRFKLLAKDDRMLGELVVQAEGGCTLSIHEQDFVEGIVLQAAVALENALLHERDLQWIRVAQDLDAARDIQRSLLPKTMPSIPGFTLAARSVACYEVGGDYLDVMSLPDGSQLLMVADVAGKGLASAIVATSFRAALRSLITQPMSLPEIVNRIGQWQWDEGEEARRRYVTAIFVRLDPARDCAEIVNAGHNPGIVLRAGGSIRMIEATGTPLGILPAMRYESELIDLPAGSRLLLYTDGLTEVFCGESEFGCERLIEEFRSLQTENAGEMLDHIWETLRKFSTGSAQTDDMTAIAVCHCVTSGQETIAA